MNLSGQLNIVVGVNKELCGADKFVSDQMNRAHRDLLHLFCYPLGRMKTFVTILKNEVVTYRLKINCEYEVYRRDTVLFLVIDRFVHIVITSRSASPGHMATVSCDKCILF